MKKIIAAVPKIASAVAIVCAATAGSAFAAGPKQTTNVPFNATFTISELLSVSGITGCPLAGMISGIGETNLFGKAILAATDCVTPPQSPNAPYIFNAGKFVLTTGSGETLFATYQGEFWPTATLGVYEVRNGSFSITGGTGRYTRAYGQGKLTGEEKLSAQPFTVPATGVLTADGLISY
jgi:hypothetical protein